MILYDTVCLILMNIHNYAEKIHSNLVVDV